MELFTPDFGLVFWMFVAVALLLFVLYKWGWPAIIKMVEGRADLIDKGVEYAQNAKVQLDNAQQEAQKYVADARHQQADIIAEANKMKSQIVEEARDEARKEAQKVMDSAKLSIEQSRKEAEKNLRDEVSRYALAIAGQVTREQLKETEAQKRLVNSMLDEIEKNN